MNTKIRTILATLVAAVSLAATTVVPAVSQAQDGSGNPSVPCTVLAEAAGIAIAVGSAAAETGQYESAEFYFQMASDYAQKARDQGCGEAGAEGRSPARGLPAPRGGAMTTPPLTTRPVVVKSATPAERLG